MSAHSEKPQSFRLGAVSLTALPNAKKAATDKRFAGDASAATAYYATFTDKYNIEHRMLFDSGLGGPDADQGRLAAALKAAGLGPDSPNEAYFSHLREDCAKSYFKGGKPFLSAAMHNFCSGDVIYGDPTPENEKRVDALMDVLRGGLGDLAGSYTPQPRQPGLLVFDFARGFTPGHSVFYLDLGSGVRLAFIGELVRFAPTQLEQPGLSVDECFDANADAASRKAVLDTIIANNWFVAGTHLPYPGIGTIAPAGEGYVFSPASEADIGAAVAQAADRAAAAPASQDLPLIAKVTLAVKNTAAVDLKLEGDPNWDDQKVKYGGKLLKQPAILAPGKTGKLSVGWKQHAAELMMGVCISRATGTGMLTLTVGYKDGRMTITEEAVVGEAGIGYKVGAHTEDSVSITVGEE